MKQNILFLILTSLIYLANPCLSKERFTYLTIKDGLSQSSVKCIYQDFKGFIWAGTADGLNKFDGYQFTSYRVNPNNLNSIGGNDISCIYENPYDSALWVGTQDAGLNIYNRKLNDFVSFSIDSKLKNAFPSNFVTDLLATNDGVLWIATQTGGLCYFNPIDSTFVRPEFSSQNTFRTINCLEKDEKGNLWLGTPTGLYLWKKKARDGGQVPTIINFANDLKQLSITALEFDVKGNLWIGTQSNGLFKYHPNSRNLDFFGEIDSKLSFISNRIYAILQTKEGAVWIGTNEGLCKYNSSENEFEIFRNEENDPESLNNNTIWSLLEDHSGILWIGTFTGGLNKLDPFQYRFSKYNNYFTSKTEKNLKIDVRSIHVDNNNTIWIGTAKGILEIDKSKLHSFSKSVKIHSSDRYIGALTSSADKLFVGGGGAILQLDKDGNFTDVSKIIEQQTGEYISSFASSVTDDYNNIWFTTARGLLQYTPQNESFKLHVPLGPDSETIYVSLNPIFEDYSGKLWIASYDGRLFTFDIHTEEFELVPLRMEEQETFGFNRIFSICETKPDQIWLGTDRGLYHLESNSGKANRYLDSDGLANNIVYAVVSDNDSKIWCSTNNGISSFDPDRMIFQNYTYEDGLQNNEFNEGAYFKDKNGLIYMGGIEGLNIFDPLNLARNDFIPPVVIIGMEIQYKKATPLTFPKIFDRQISEIDNIALSYKQTTFSFEFTSLSFSLSKRNKYQYSLSDKEGNDNWIDAENRRIATYTNVPPGNYTFKVKASNSDGVWNETPTTISISIEPPFWGTWWFRSATVIILLGIIFLLVFLRIRNVNQQKRILENLVKEKTKTLQLQTNRIAIQNDELKSTNNSIRQINKQLNEQHLQIVEQRDRLLNMAGRVEDANQAKFRFFTSISHELRTPLTLIISPLKDLITNIKETDVDEIRRKLTNIYANSSKLLLIVNQLMDFRKAETDNMGMRVAEFDFVPFVQKTSALFNELAKQKKLQFSFSSTRDKIKIWADVDKLEKTIYNLLSNAFKFTPANGSVNIKVSIVQEGENTYATLSVKDNGVGIEKSMLPHIFERFYQLEQNSNHLQMGSGLGLALVSKYIELHKGFVSVQSSSGIGSEFVVKLPLGRKHFDDNVKFDEKIVDNTELLQATIGDYIPISAEGLSVMDKKEAPTLLIVEDDNNLRSYMKEILSTKYNVEEAENAKKGFQLVLSKHPDLIICDVMLPGSNGFELCERIKSDFQTCHLPVILLTSLADKQNQMSGIKAGADDYISKPFDMQHLFLSIDNLIQGRLRLQKKYNLSHTNNIKAVVTNSKDQQFLKDAEKCVEKNIIDSSFNVELFCMQMQISQPQCYRKIKAITGLNISEFIRNTRLKRASELLKNGDYKINEVAYETGFNDPNYFTKSFTKLYGITPTDYTKSF